MKTSRVEFHKGAAERYPFLNEAELMKNKKEEKTKIHWIYLKTSRVEFHKGAAERYPFLNEAELMKNKKEEKTKIHWI